MLEAELAVARRNRDELAAALHAADERVRGQQSRAGEMSADLVERTAALEILQRQTREQISLLTQDVRLAQSHRADAEARARAAEQRAGDAVATLARLQERCGALEVDRDILRDPMLRLEAGAAEDERLLSMGRGHLAALEEECTRLRALVVEAPRQEATVRAARRRTARRRAPAHRRPAARCRAPPPSCA